MISRRNFVKDSVASITGAAGLVGLGFGYGYGELNGRLHAEAFTPAQGADAGGVATYQQIQPDNPGSQQPGPMPVANVLDFGATGDGVSDDRLAIQNASDSLRDMGGTLLLPPGVYRLSRDPKHYCGVRVYSNMQIVGSGRGNTVLKWLDDVTDNEHHYVLAAHEGFVENVTLRDFTIDGNRGRSNRDFHIVGEGIEMDGRNLYLSNLHIKDVLGEGIDCDRCDGVVIQGCIIENTGGNGIHCSDPQSRNVHISQCVTRNCAHGRRKSGNVRFGGLVLRGSGIQVDGHRSINDAQIANIEGQGMGRDSELALVNVSGYSDLSDARGFRIGMTGNVRLSGCSALLVNSTETAYRFQGFSGWLTLSNCHAETKTGKAIAGSLISDNGVQDATAFGISVQGGRYLARENASVLVDVSVEISADLAITGNVFRGGLVRLVARDHGKKSAGMFSQNILSVSPNIDGFENELHTDGIVIR